MSLLGVWAAGSTQENFNGARTPMERTDTACEVNTVIISEPLLNLDCICLSFSHGSEDKKPFSIKEYFLLNLHSLRKEKCLVTLNQ